MNRKIVMWLLTTVLLSTVSFAEAQQAAKIPRIGLLAGGHGFGSAGDAFRQSLRELGWIDGRNIAIESRLAEASLDRLPNLAGELVQRRVAVIVADSDPAARAAKQATRAIPIVVVAVGDPVREGLVSSLARPGGNITGLTSISEALSGKRLELISEAFPKLRRLAVLWNPANSSNVLEFKEMETAGRTLGLKTSVPGGARCGGFRRRIRARRQGASQCAHRDAGPPHR